MNSLGMDTIDQIKLYLMGRIYKHPKDLIIDDDISEVRSDRKESEEDE